MPSFHDHHQKLITRVKAGDRVRLRSTIADTLTEFEFTVQSVTWYSLTATKPVFVDSDVFNQFGETEFNIVEGNVIVSINGVPY